MQDDIPLHNSKLAKNYLEKNVEVLDWPGNRSDLIPIENLWHLVKTNEADQYLFCVELLKTTKKLC